MSLLKPKVEMVAKGEDNSRVLLVDISREVIASGDSLRILDGNENYLSDPMSSYNFSHPKQACLVILKGMTPVFIVYDWNGIPVEMLRASKQ